MNEYELNGVYACDCTPCCVLYVSDLQVDKLRELDGRIDAIDARKTNNRAVCAYVTFEEEEGALRAVATYPKSLLYWVCQPRYVCMQRIAVFGVWSGVSHRVVP